MNKGIREAQNKVDTTIVFKARMKTSEFTRICIDRIRFLRVKADLTNAQLSCFLGRADNYLSELEKGKNSLSLEVLVNVFNIFELKPAQFFADGFFAGIEKQPARLEKYKQIKNFLPQMQERRKIEKFYRQKRKENNLLDY